MTDQLAINQAGEIVAQPMTWDNKPVYSPSTVREGLFAVEAFEQMPGQTSMGTEELDNEWRAERAAAAPLKRGSACVFTYDNCRMSGEVDDVSSCGITVYGREDNRRHLVGSQDVRHETAQEQDRRERLGYYVQDDPERRS